MIGAMSRTPQEWYAHPQGALLAQTPMIEIVKIGDSDPDLPPLTNATRPLSGINVASLTHVIAGPVVSRTLAEQGAQVLDLANPALEVGCPHRRHARRVPLDIHGSEAKGVLRQGRRVDPRRGRGGRELPRQ